MDHLKMTAKFEISSSLRNIDDTSDRNRRVSIRVDTSECGQTLHISCIHRLLGELVNSFSHRFAGIDFL